MDDDFDNYIPQISTMDYNLLAGGNSNNAGSNSGGSSYMFEGGQQPGASALNQNNRFANMIPGTNPQQQQQYPSNAAATEYSRTASQGYPPGFVPPPGAVVPPHIQMAQHQMATHGHFPHGYGMPPPNMGKPPQPVQQQAPAKSKSKKSKKVSAITAEGANPEHGVGMIPPNMGQQQHLPPHFQQMGGYYYKNQPGPSQQMSTAMIASPPQQQDKGAQKWHPSQYQHQEEQQKKEQQFQQQMAQHQQSNQQQQYAAQHPPMGTQMQQHQSAQQQQAIYSNSGQQQYPGYPQPPQHQTKISPPQQQKTKQAQQQPQYPQQYYGQQQQPQQYAQQQMQQQQSGQYPGMGMPPQGVYPYPHGAAEYAQQQTMQRQAFYAHQQQMMAAAPSAANSGTYYQPPAYMNAYMAQQQQIYRELFECDQQFGALMAQGQQTPEMGMRIEKLQIHRGYLQSQLMHLQQHAAAAAAQAGIPPGAIPTSRGEQQPPTGMMAQYPPYPGGQQAQSSQHQAAAIPVQQKLPPSSYAAPGAPAQYPQAPQAQPNAAFHSPSSGVTGAYQQQPVPPHPQHQPQQQQQQVPPQIAQQQQQQSYPAQHLASPSVAVMSASNQVQVNIVPEMPGRTLISVYHSQDIPPTAVVTSTAMQPYSVQSDASAQSLSAKDSIPPEPLPPNIAQEQKRRKMQQQRELEEEEQIQQAARTMPPLPSQQMIQFEQKQRELQQQEEQMKAFRQRVASHPPQPKQVNIVAEAELAQQHQQRATDVVEVSLAGTPPSFVEVSVARHFAAPNCYLTAECSINVPIAEKAEPLTLSTVEVEEKMVEEQVEQEHQKKDEEERSSILREVKLEDMATSEMDQLCEMPVTESSKTLAGQEIPTDVEMENLTVADSTSDQKTPFGVDAETLSVSTSDAFLSKLDDKEDSTADDSVCPGTGASSSTKETTPMPMFADDSLTANTSEQAASSSQLASYSLSASAGAKSKSRSKKRRQSLDWNRRDEDDDYVGGKKKRRKSVKREVSMDPADELDEDLLMEKRRSTRKQPTGKKAKYGVDSEEDDFEEGAKLAPQQEMALAVEPVEERIVEKILGVRFGKRRVRKEKESQKEGEKEPQEKEDEQKEKDNEGIKEGEVDAVEQTKDDVEKLDTEKATEREEKITEVENGNKEEKNMEENGESKNGEEQQQSEKRENDVEEEEIEVEELYVKYKNFSYLHCEWKTIEELDEMGDKRVIGKLNRYKQKFGETTTVAGEDDEQEYFNEDFTVVTRVLDETYDEGEQQHYVYVKWKALSYDDCTWELLQNVPENKVAEYRQRAKFDPCKAKEMSRLSPNEFAQVAVPKDKVYKNDNMLREYQHEGVNWLLWTWANARNCILADEMGLGKTVQTIAFFQSIYDTGIHGPFLVVVPLSTLSNWEREFENWTDINAIVYHGGAPSRQIIQNCEFYYKDKRKNVIKFDAMITTYEVVVQEVEVLKRINFRVCVIDEAHRIKNRNCKLLQSGLLSLKMEHRVLLTGTPLQNNIQELFSLLNFLEPEQFANSEAFLQQFGQCQTEDQVQKLQEILKPMMLRRLKEDVEKELQPKEETIIEVQLSNIQKKYYRAVLERNFTHLMKGTTPSLINTMMQLRKCCNHPYLINGAEEQILAELKQSHPEKAEDELQTFGLISSSGKLVLIDKLLPKLHADGHKVLIFSQMVRVLDLLEEYLSIKSYPFERIDGNIRGNERQAAIDRFSRPENNDRFVFLLCTRAGGLGINLTAADTVIIFDSDWNPQNDLQAQARCHRIGQTKPVKIYRLITSNSYEREMFDKASLKLGLDKAVLQSMLHKSDNSQQMSRQEVEDLLRKGAYGAIMDEDNEGTKFSEEDIDTILLRRTQTIRLEPGVKGSTFAKASFTSSHNREDIDIQDPDFWSKWAKKANIDMDALNDDYSGKHLIVHEPRSRKKRFEAENLKGNSESGEEGFSEEDDRSQSTPNKIADGVKNRSAKRRRRGGALGEYDEDYPYKPDELAFNKSSYFKVEKLLTQFGWGRWAALKAFSDLTEQELEHISRTLLLNCVREFRGDEKIREYVWKMITPSNETAKIREKSGGTDGSNKYHQGWAALPEYNPPFICVDASFQRHLHRHSNKLLNRMHQLHFLTTAVIQEKAVEGVTGEVHEMNLELPENVDNWLIMPNWDRDCDRDLLVGVYKHGMDNWEQVHADAKLCFSEKNVQFPTTLDLNNRFKYLVSMLQKRAEASTSSAPKTEIQWSKVEESDFMRILRNYGVKDDTNSENVINWGRFRELSICLQKKTDGEMLEMLYCVLAMCTKQQGGVLSTMDERRAERVDSITAKAAEKLMNRLHLMRKVHAIITMGIQNIRGMLKMVSLDVMPKGWTEAHDEHLLIVVDKFGLEDIHGKVKLLPKLFESISPIDENLLLRRVVEICITLETGKWSGPASIEMLQDGNESLMPCTSAQAAGTAKAAQKNNSGSGNTRKKVEPATGRRAQSGTDKLGIAGGSIQTGKSTLATGKNMPSMNYSEQQALLKMMEQMANPNYLLSLMSLMNPGTSGGSSGSAASSSSSAAALQQQFQQLQTLLTLSALGGADPNLASIGASLAGMMPPTTNSSAQKQSTALDTKTDALNLSKRGEVQKATTPVSKVAKTTPSSSTPTMSASLPSSSNNPRPSISSADACLSTGLSTSAINKLSQLSVPELLAYSNLSHDIRIPVVHIETGQRIDSDKAPTLKSLDQWLKSNQKYNVDLLSLATSHPSLFSATTLPTTSGQKTPISTPKPVVQKQTLDTVQKPVKQMEKTVPSITQPLIDKKSAAANAAAQKEAALQSSLASSLFGMPDLQSTSNSATTAAQMAALNQFLVGLTPSNTASTSQLQTSSNVASSQQQSPNLKSIEQQMLLLQQAMTLGGASNGNNPYAFLYQNPSDLFGMKPSQSFGLGQPAPSSTPSSSSLGTSVEQMSAALASAAAGFGTVKGATTTNQSDINALSAAALTSELYLTAMASSLQPFMGTTAVQSLTPSLMQQQQSASSSAASMAGMNEQLLQLLQAAGMDPLLGTTAPPRSSTTTSSVGGVLVSAPPKSSSSAAIGQREAKTAAAQSRAEDSSMGGVKKGTGGGKGLKLNAVLEKLNASSNQAGPPIPESQATSTTIAESEEKRGTEGTSDTK